MKRLNLLLISMFIIGCHNSLSHKNAVVDSAKAIDSTKVNPPIITNNAVSTNNSSEQTQSELKVKCMFIDIVNTQQFFYVIDNQYCLILNKICKYNYDSSNQILNIYNNGINSNFIDNGVYYKVCSGYKFKELIPQLLLNDPNNSLENLYHISTNLNNPSFALIGVQKISSDKFEMSRNIGAFKQIALYHPIDLNTNNYLSSSIYYLINDLKASLEHFQLSYLTTENKINSLKDKGKENVDGLLSNKVDDNYTSLMEKWGKLNNEKSSVDTFLTTWNQKSITFDELLPQLAKVILTFKKLDDDNDEFNKKLDNEILPITQQSN